MAFHGYMTSEITCSTLPVCCEVLAWSQATLCNTPIQVSPSKPWLLLHWSYIGATSQLLCEVMLWLWLCHGCCYDCCVNQERGCVMATCQSGKNKLSAVPMGLWSFFQPLSLPFIYPGFNKQCEQRDNWWYEEDQQYRHWITLLTDLHCHVAS